MADYFKQHGERLAELGYLIVPLPPGSKGPNRKGWPKFELTAPTIRQWAANGSAHDGVGILAATTPAIDVDILDPQIADQMSQEIDRIFAGQALMTRTGRAPKFLIPFRSEEPFRKLSSHVYTDGEHEHKVEILGDGQQWVAYHVHPDTERPYSWFDGVGSEGIRSVGRNELPLLDRESAQRVIDAFEVLAAERVAAGRWSVKTRMRDVSVGDGTAEADPFAQYVEPVKDLTRSQVEWVVSRIVNREDDYDRWLSVLCAVHHQLGEDGIEVARGYSEKSAKHVKEVFEDKYASLGSYKGPMTTLRSFLHETGQPPKPKVEPLQPDRVFRFYRGDEYSEDFVGGRELVEDVFPAQGTGMMFGPSGSGKTFWMLDMAFHVQNGARWRDKDVAQGDVMYIAAEAGRGIKKRIRGVLNAHPDWRAPFFADMAPDLSDVEWIKTIRDAAQAAGHPAMVVIDTMSASFAGDDSSQADVAPMIRNLTSLSLALECLVVFVHHTTKEGTSWRGSGAFFADVDAVLELVSSGEGAARKQHITQRKHRDGEAGKDYPFDLVVTASLGTKPNGKEITTMLVEQSFEKAVKKDRKEGANARFLREVFAEIDAGMGEVTAADLLDAAAEKFGKGFRRDNYRRALAQIIGYEGACLPYETVIYL